MSAAELRQAAETLRELAGNVTAHSGGSNLWFEADVDLRNAIRGTFLGNKESAPDDATFIATMHPGVGLALADLLDFATETAQGWELIGNLDPSGWPEPTRLAHILARLINGDAS